MPTARNDPDEIFDEFSSQEIDSKYRLIILAAKRSKQLQRGARPRIAIDPTKHKLTRIALEEVIRGKIQFYRITPGEAAPTPRPLRFTAPNDPPRLDVYSPIELAMAEGLEGDDDERIPLYPPESED